ncbi:hypothetical protein DPX16_12331 [Anabarilius grahami]|uniref:Interleukin-1 beta n=1 Tax=Anabarilius grahami TaxID=495550 RepID=A0A3N0XFU4_ANAGA|nr:hypothetical protein DPX16_12331 [Anabarilius grahami]
MSNCLEHPVRSDAGNDVSHSFTNTRERSLPSSDLTHRMLKAVGHSGVLEIVSEENCGMKKMKVRFSLSIISEDDLEMEGHQELPHSQPELEDKDIEDNCFYDDDQMLVSLANMSFNLVVDQNPDTDKPLCSCDRQFNEIVVMPEQADLAFISAIGRLIKEHDNLYLKSKQKCMYITSEENQICLEDTMSAKITIFQCMATTDTKSGVPVVLNFTGTDNFFCCTDEGGEIILKVTIIHQPSPRTTEERESEDTCVMKRKMIVRFSLTMLIEEDFEMDGHQELSHPQPELEDEDICNEIAVMPEQADLAFISAIGRLIKEHDNLYLKSKQKCMYITSEENQICLEDTMSAKITIFQCMATTDTKSGVPVVLNFTGTDNFFCCTDEGGEIILKVTRYDKRKLNNPGDDQEKLAHVFYMSREPGGLLHFESAHHRGWFIHTVDGNAVKMQRGKLTSSNCFVLIETDTTKIIQY